MRIDVVYTISQIHPKVYLTGITGVREGEIPEAVDTVITVCQDSVEENVSPDVGYKFFNMADGPHDGRGDGTYELFEEAADTLLERLSHGETVLIHCHVGKSRSVSVSIAALAAYEDVSYSEMRKQVEGARPQASPKETLKEYTRMYVSGSSSSKAQQVAERLQGEAEDE